MISGIAHSKPRSFRQAQKTRQITGPKCRIPKSCYKGPLMTQGASLEETLSCNSARISPDHDSGKGCLACHVSECLRARAFPVSSRPGFARSARQNRNSRLESFHTVKWCIKNLERKISSGRRVRVGRDLHLRNRLEIALISNLGGGPRTERSHEARSRYGNKLVVTE